MAAPSGLTSLPRGGNIRLPLQYELVNLWVKTKEGKEEKANIRIILVDPNGKELNRIDKELILPSDKRRMREINKIQGITLTESGIYNFVISIKQNGSSKYEEVVKLPLEVQINKNPNNNPQLN